jgi:hypothetical protein
MSELRTQAADLVEHPIEPSAAATYRRLRLAGLSPREAGSLVGHLRGLSPVPGGWTIEEVEHLLFVRELVRLGRMGS